MTKTQVINYGLIALGQRPLPNPEFLDTEEARIMNALYGIAREQLIAEIEWPCFVKYSPPLSLLENGDTAKYWPFTYALPSDLIRVISVVDIFGFELRDVQGEAYSVTAQPLWAIEGGELKSTNSPCYLKYLYNPPDTFVFPGYFGRALGMNLAHGCAMRIGHDEKYQEKLFQLSLYAKAEGVVEAMKGSYGEALHSVKWSDHR